MLSVNTNAGAMQALQVLNNTNKNLNEVQSRISTGQKVSNAKDSAAVWAVASTMNSDKSGFTALKDNLSVAESAVSVARGSAESITSLLDEMKTKIVAAQDGNIDRDKLQNDLKELREQIKGVAGASQFNGANYLKGTGEVKVLASLDRDASSVGTSYITFEKQNLVVGEAAASKVKVVEAGATAVSAKASIVDLGITLDPTNASNGELSLKIGGVATTTTIDLGAINTLASAASVIQTALQTDFGSGVTVTVTDGKIRLNDANGRGITEVTEATAGLGQFNLDTVTKISDGNTDASAVASKSEISIDAYKVGGTSYTAGDFQTLTMTRSDGSTVESDVSAAANMSAVATQLQTDLGAGNTVTWDVNQGKLSITDADGRGINLKMEGNKAGKLSALETLDVTTQSGAEKALQDIETMMQSSIDSAAAFGSTQKRLGIQKEFMSKLTDAMTSGVGALVDADLTAESARMQALQTQQQLGAQALSMANQAP
jgi:flagellin